MRQNLYLVNKKGGKSLRVSLFISGVGGSELLALPPDDVKKNLPREIKCPISRSNGQKGGEGSIQAGTGDNPAMGYLVSTN